MTDEFPKASPHYEIRILGWVNPQMKDWFGGLDLVTLSPGGGPVVTVMTGALADQAALYGVLNRIRDLGLRLISVNPVAPILITRGQNV